MAPPTWAAVAKALLSELDAHPGRLALVAEGPEGIMKTLGGVLGEPVHHVGSLLTSSETPPKQPEILAILSQKVLLDDVEILFSPELSLNPMAVLRNLARRGPRIVRWPGTIEGRHATFSRPGRSDYCIAPLSDVVILTPKLTRFPDEVPFSVRRIP